MVARTPPNQKTLAVAPLNPALLRETVNKVDRCMARLQELQYTVAGGTKIISGVNLSPRSTRGYLRTSLRCKQESLRIKNAAPKKSPAGKFQEKSGEWRRMSLPAMLVGETVGEILQASQFAREIVESISNKTKKLTAMDDPKTPVTKRKKQRQEPEQNSVLRSRRKREKLITLQSLRSESDRFPSQRVRSQINFKVSPPKKRESEKENWRYSANRVSPRNRPPWAKKAVLFPNPLFLSTPSQPHKFCKTRSPIITRKRETPHKFLIKSPPSVSKFQVKIKSPAPVMSLSPTRVSSLMKKSPKVSTVSKLRRSFSPSRLANRLVSPLKSRKSVEMMSGLKQRPSFTTVRFSTGRI